MVGSLYTTIKNTSGAARYYGWLPPHGRELAEDEEVNVPGDLTTRLASNRDYGRAFKAFEADLDNTDIVILKTPAVHLYDSEDNNVKLLALNNATLGTIDPDWGYYSEVGEGDFVAGG